MYFMKMLRDLENFLYQVTLILGILWEIFSAH